MKPRLPNPNSRKPVDTTTSQNSRGQNNGLARTIKEMKRQAQVPSPQDLQKMQRQRVRSVYSIASRALGFYSRARGNSNNRIAMELNVFLLWLQGKSLQMNGLPTRPSELKTKSANAIVKRIIASVVGKLAKMPEFQGRTQEQIFAELNALREKHA